MASLIASCAVLNSAEKIRKLIERFGEEPFEVIEKQKVLGFIAVNKSLGWLSVSDEGERWFVLLTSDKHTHNRAFGRRAYGGDFRKDNGERSVRSWGFSGAWESAISMWPVEKESDAIMVFSHMVKMIDLAYVRHIEDSSVVSEIGR